MLFFPLQMLKCFLKRKLSWKRVALEKTQQSVDILRVGFILLVRGSFLGGCFVASYPPNLKPLQIPSAFFFHFPNMFPFMFPMCSQGCSQQCLALIPYVLPKVLPFSPIYLGKRGYTPSFQRIFYFGKPLQFQPFYFFGDGPIKLAHCPKKKSWTRKALPTNQT